MDLHLKILSMAVYDSILIDKEMMGACQREKTIKEMFEVSMEVIGKTLQ